MNLKRISVVLVVVCASLLLTSVARRPGSPTLTSITVAQITDPWDLGALPVGALRQFTATGNYSDGSTQYLTQKVTWSASDSSIAAVSPIGLVAAASPGTVAINATLSGVAGSSTLTVVAATLSAIAITPSTISMQAGLILQFNATAAFGPQSIQDVTSTAVWSSSSPSVAVVSSSGLVKALSAGTTTLSASFNQQGGTTTLTVTSSRPPNLGLWSAPQSLGMTAIHAALLHTGKVLVFGYPQPSPARLIDPVSNTVSDVTFSDLVDIFCAGQSFLPDGRLFVDGGMLDAVYPVKAGIYNSSIFDPATNTWSEGPSMKYARWYPTTVPMPDGSVFVLAGTDQTGRVIQRATESYNPATNSWTELPTSAWVPTPPDNYPLMTVLSSGKLFYAAPRQDSQMYNPATQSWSFVANMNFGIRYHAAVALLPKSQQVMVVGGAATDVGNGGNPTNTAEVIDFSSTTPTWSYATPMNIPRYNLNLIYLADGTLLAVGGNQNGEYGKPVSQPELYNPASGTWTLLPPQVAVRGYHSTALLLPDGRVLSSGSDSQKPFEKTYETYSPPYLFKGSRPTITSSPSSVTYNQAFTITTPNASSIQRVALLRPGATTHANHMDDHYYVDLAWSAGVGQLNVTAPASPNIAPPGYYLLVIVNGNGVPSVMPFVQLQAAASNEKGKAPSAAPANLN